MVSNRMWRGVPVKAAVALGLAIVLVVVPGTPPGASPVGAQDEMPPTIEPASPPMAPELLLAQESSEEPAPKPAESTQPSGPAPAFSPSGPATGAGSGTGTGTGTSAGSGAPGPRPDSGFNPPPPLLGAVVYENSLQDERVFKSGYCFGRKAFTQYVGEGFKMRVMGECPILSEEAWITVQANDVMIGDGEVALDFKLVDGASRGTVGLYVRNVNEQAIGVHVHPARGEASLFVVNGGKQKDLGYRANLVVPQGDWNRLAMRVSGHDVWLLVNDEPVLHAGEVHADAGRVIVGLIRDGSFEDEDETAVVFRDLTLSSLEGGESGRAPTGP